MESKVKSVTGNGTFDSQYGIPHDQNDPNSKKVMFKYEYEMEDGTVLTANHKSYTAPFKTGDAVEYEITKENEYGKQGKVSKPSENNYSKPDSKGMKVGHAITNGVSMFNTHGSDYVDLSKIENTPKAIIKEYSKMIYQINEELNNEL